MIISGGENVYPAEVEAALLQIEGVVDAAVVAVPDERWGEVGLAFVVLDESLDRSLDEQRLRRALEPRLARYKIPKYFRTIGALPRNATGKLMRPALREQARAAHDERREDTT